MRAFLIAIGFVMAGCTLSSSGGDDSPSLPPDGGDGGGGGGAGGSPVGQSFLLERAQTGFSGCAFVEEDRSHRLVIQPQGVLADETPVSGAIVRAVAAREAGGDPPNVTFFLNEGWTRSQSSKSVRISFELWIDGDQSFSGRASTSFNFDSPETGPSTCSYAWALLRPGV